MLNLETFRLSHSGVLESYENREEYQVDQIMDPE